jgi:hypothetical protein
MNRLIITCSFICFVIMGLCSFEKIENNKLGVPFVRGRIVKVNPASNEAILRVSLVNNSADTIYYLSFTCDGWSKDIVYDTNIVDVVSINCNATYPLKLKIAPHDSDARDVNCFLTHKRSFDDIKGRKYRLGYHWRALSREQVINNDMNVWKLPNLTDEIIWGDTLEIK